MASSALLEASASTSATAFGAGKPGVVNFHQSFVGEQIGFRGVQQTRGFTLSALQPLRSRRFRSRKAGVCAQTTAASPVPVLDPALQDTLKRAVAKKAVELVKAGNVVAGLGTGSTASMAIEELGKLIQAGKLKDIVGVGTSYQSRVLARQFGVKTVDLNDVNHIDISFDGADEVDRNMNLIKGGGAAHTLDKNGDDYHGYFGALLQQWSAFFGREFEAIFTVHAKRCTSVELEVVVPASERQERQQGRRRQRLAAMFLLCSSPMLLTQMPGKLLAEEVKKEKANNDQNILGGLLSIFDPDETTKLGKKLPKAYLKSARDVVQTLRTSFSEDTSNDAKFRRNADSAKGAIREYISNWRGAKLVDAEESYQALERALRILGEFYSKKGPRAVLPEDVRLRVLEDLQQADDAL